MTRFPVRIAPGRLKPDLATQFPWRCQEHLAAGTPICVNECCGDCYFLAPGDGCQLGPMRPVRCQTYPLIPQRNRVLVHGRCPDSQHFVRLLGEKDPRALALLDVAVAMSDVLHEGGEDHSMEIEWMMDYTADGWGGPVVWKRGRGIVAPERETPAVDRKRPRIPPRKR